MANEFGVFNLGNVLANAENIKTSQAARTQTNALLERNAQGQVLLQNAVSEIDSTSNTGGPAFNALAGFDIGTANKLQDVFNERQDQQRQEFEQKRQDERDEADSGLALLEAIVSAKKKGVRPSVFLDVINSDVVEALEEQGFDLSKTTSSQDDEFIQAFVQELVKTASPKGQEIARRILGGKRDTSNIIQFQNPQGDIREVRADSLEADQLAADPSFNRVGIVQRQETGGVGSFGKSELNKFKARVAKFNTLSRSAEELINQLKGSPDAATTTGLFASFGNRIKTESVALARQAGLKLESIDEGLAKFGGTLDAGGLAGKSRVFRTGVLSVALQFASATGLGEGRALTDKDVERAIGLVTGGAADPAIIADVLANGLQFIRFGIEETAKVNGLELNGNLQLRENFLAAPETETSEITDNSDEALKRRLGIQ